MSQPDPLPVLAIEISTDEARAFAVERLLWLRFWLDNGASLPRIADDLRRLADRMTAGVDKDVAQRLAAADRALRGPTIGAVLRRRPAA